jgi:hypothetical protein
MLVAGVVGTLGAVANGCSSDDGGHELDCSDLQDQSTEPATIVVENKRSTPIYFVSNDFCSSGVSAPVTDEHGNVVSGYPGCGQTCSEMMAEDLWGCEEGDCFDGGGLVMLGPGARTTLQWHGGIYQTETLDSDCAQSQERIGASCVHLVPAPAARYTVKVDAVRTATCDNQDGRGPHPCICASSPESTCSIFESFTTADPVSKIVDFDFPTKGEVVVSIE